MREIEKVDIVQHLKDTYMPYAMDTLLDRALPDIRDGFKPIHKKILYSMYKKGIRYNKDRAKSTEPMAETMKVHHHSDAGIYEALSIMTEQNEGLLTPYLDGEGSFGKVYSSDSPSAARYTYCRLNKFAEEYFKDIEVLKMLGEDKDHLYPEVLSASFPNILVKNNEGIAVGFACKFPSFNLEEVCNATIEYIKDKDVELLEHIKGFDFSTGGQLLYNRSELDKVIETGRGKLTVRSKYRYDEKNRIIEVYEIPYTTTVQTIIKEVTELIKDGKLKDVIDIRDACGYNKKLQREELKIEIEVKKNCNADYLMKILFQKTSLQDNFNVNMNCIVDYAPKVVGVRGVLKEWLKFRQECVIKKLGFDIAKSEDRLHVQKGLEKVLLDIDKCINIIKNSKDEEILDKLCKEFSIDNIQAETISNMKLRNINKDYIVKQLKDIKDLELSIQDLKYKISTPSEIDNIIINELERVRDTYKQPRKTEIIENEIISKDILIEDYNCRVLYTNNYIKKHLKFSDNHKLKEDEIILGDIESNNKDTLMIITNKANRYKIAVNDLDTVTPSSYGQYIPSLIELEEDEKIVKIISVSSDKGDVVVVYKNGKIAKIGIKSFLSANKKLVGCYNQESELLDIQYVEKDTNVFLLSSNGKGLIISTKDLNSKVSRNTQGVTGIKLKDGDICVGCKIGITKDDSFNLHTTNDREIYIHMDNVSVNESKNIFDYISGRAANQGNHIFYSSSKNVKVDRVEF